MSTADPPDPGLRVVIAMTEALPRPTLQALIEMIAVRLSAPAPAPPERRVAQLGFLADMLRESPATGHGPSRVAKVDYERRRPAGAQSAATLVKQYGTWLKACRAAASLAPDGAVRGEGQPWPSPALGKPRTRAYSRDEAARTLADCTGQLGRRPTTAEYAGWRQRRQDTARRGGAPTPRIACMTTVHALFGSWELALDAAGAYEIERQTITARQALLDAPAKAPTKSISPKAVFAQLEPDVLDQLRIDERDRLRIARRGFGWLALSQAARIASTLNGSLDWIAGRRADHGPPAPPNAALSAAAVRAECKRARLPLKALAQALEVSPAAFKGLVEGRGEPTLGQLSRIAEVLSCPIDALCAPTGSAMP